MRRKHHRAYGVEWNEGQSSPTCQRIGQGRSAAAATKLPDNLMALQSRMRRCVMNDAGVIQYYLDPTNGVFKENGEASVLTGADGQVVVEIQQGWLKYWYSGTTHHWMISKEQFNGASRLDAFYKNDEWVKNRYIGAYEGTLYDVSATAYVDGIRLEAANTVFAANAGAGTATISRTVATNPFTKLGVGTKIITGSGINPGPFTVTVVGNQTVTIAETLANETVSAYIETQKNWTATTGDKLSSVSGKSPICYGTRANFRAIAKNRGTGWRQQDYDLVSAIQLLYLTEYADWNSQSMIGAGLTDWTSAWPAYNDNNPINFTGITNSLGNATGNLSKGNGVVGSYMSYRGIENFFGHSWKWVDGININSNVPYVSNKDTVFADDTTTNYTALGITLAAENGYQVTLEQIARGFLPASIGGASNTYITDYYYQNTGWRVALLGGSAAGGAGAGVAGWSLDVTSGYLHRNVGARLSW